MKFLDVSLQEREEPKIEQETQSSKYDWRFENSINSGTKFLEIEKDNFKYNKWRTNNSLSNFIDTLFYSNEMNLNYHVTDQMHYDYLFYAIRKSDGRILHKEALAGPSSATPTPFIFKDCLYTSFISGNVGFMGFPKINPTLEVYKTNLCKSRKDDKLVL